MILTVDIGNTATAIGAYVDGEIRRMRRCGPALDQIEAELREFVGDDTVAGVAIASVVPECNPTWCSAAHSVCRAEPLMVDHECRLDVALDYPEPQRIGADRLANACAAKMLFGAPVVVADFGTALTFDVVSSQSAYIGGVIAPGLQVMLDCLSDRTALLPRISLRTSDRKVGRSTEEAMLIGVNSGYRGLVRAIIDDITSEIGPFAFCATGGYAERVLEGLADQCRLVPELTLLGIGRIYELNIPSRTRPSKPSSIY